MNLSGCTGLKEVPVFPNATIVNLSGCTSLRAVPEFPKAINVNLTDCTGLKAVPKFLKATGVDLSGCTGLKAVPEFPNATHVNLTGCTGLKAVPEFPEATGVDLSGCTTLIQKWTAEKLIPLLTAAGKSVSEVLATGCWECHTWSNCPMHAVFGVGSVTEVPSEWRQDAGIFVRLFDSEQLEKPVV